MHAHARTHATIEMGALSLANTTAICLLPPVTKRMHAFTRTPQAHITTHTPRTQPYSSTSPIAGDSIGPSPRPRSPVHSAGWSRRAQTVAAAAGQWRWPGQGSGGGAEQGWVYPLRSLCLETRQSTWHGIQFACSLPGYFLCALCPETWPGLGQR
jgi:hypothetical protein